jgi:hypothetical protein
VAVEQLPSQVEAWLSEANAGGALERHQSQIRALQQFLEVLLGELDGAWQKLAGTPEGTPLVGAGAPLQTLLRRAFAVWRYYKERFDQRLSAETAYQRFLAVADDVSFDAQQATL